MKQNKKAIGAVAVASLAYSTLPIFTMFAYREGVLPMPLLGIRFILASLILAAIAVSKNRSALKIPRTDIKRYVALSIGGFGASSFFYFYALKYASAPVISSLLYAYPAFVAIGAWMLFKESITAKQWSAIGLTVIGCALVGGVLGAPVEVSLPGILLGLSAALAYASFNLLSQRWLPGRSSSTMMAYVFGISGVSFLIVSLFVHGPGFVSDIIGWPSRAWLYLVLIVLIPTIVAILLYLRGIRRLGAAQAAILSTLEPLLTVLLSWWVLNQELGAVQLIGVLCIVGGVTITSLASNKIEPSPNAPLTDDEVMAREDDAIEDVSQHEGDVLSVAVDSSGGKRRRGLTFWFRAILSVVAVFIVVELALIGGFFWIINLPLPDITIENIADRSSQTTTVYAVDGSVIAKWHGDEERIPLETDEIPQIVYDAVVAIEDRRFYEHAGVDPKGILRALLRNTQEGVIKQGGSTITQQVIKMLYVGNERTYIRKIQEALMATRAEMGYDKRDILASYLNMAYFGQGAYGIESAAKIYFNKTVGRLTVAEAATLAGLVRSPGAYNAFDNPSPVVQRRQLVLDAMLEERFIDRAEHDVSSTEPLGVARKYVRKDTISYPYFVDYVRRNLTTIVGAEKLDYGGLKVYTTLDPALQQAAQDAAGMFKGKKDPEVSIVSVRNTDGALLAMVGGRDWGKNQFNLATQGKRQPGSAFKPVVLATALENDVSLSKVFDASPFETKVKDGVWKVRNYSDTSAGSRMTLRAATIWSANTVYARLIMDVGPKKVVSMAHDLGFSSEIDPDPAIALGGLKYGVSPLEMASAYATFSRKGLKVQPIAITRVLGRDHEVLYVADSEAKPERVFSKSTGDQLSSTLHEVVSQGTGKAASSVAGAAGKTGTTQSYRDAWFVGWTNKVATAVWMGYPQAQIDMTDVRGTKVTGGSFPAQMWTRYMKKAYEVRPEEGFLFSRDELLNGELAAPIYDENGNEISQ